MTDDSPQNEDEEFGLDVDFETMPSDSDEPDPKKDEGFGVDLELDTSGFEPGLELDKSGLEPEPPAPQPNVPGPVSPGPHSPPRPAGSTHSPYQPGPGPQPGPPIGPAGMPGPQHRPAGPPGPQHRPAGPPGPQHGPAGRPRPQRPPGPPGPGIGSRGSPGLSSAIQRALAVGVVVLVLVILAVTLLSDSEPPASSIPQQALEDGERAFHQGKWVEALEAFQRLRRFPTSAEAQAVREQGLEAQAIKEIMEAEPSATTIHRLEGLARLFPDRVEVRTRLGEVRKALSSGARVASPDEDAGQN